MFRSFLIFFLLPILIVNVAKTSERCPRHGLNAILSRDFLCQINQSLIFKLSIIKISRHGQNVSLFLFPYRKCDTSLLDPNSEWSPLSHLESHEHSFTSPLVFQNCPFISAYSIVGLSQVYISKFPQIPPASQFQRPEPYIATFSCSNYSTSLVTILCINYSWAPWQSA